MRMIQKLEKLYVIRDIEASNSWLFVYNFDDKNSKIIHIWAMHK